MYKKHGKDQEANLKVTVKDLVAKALLEQGVNTETWTLMELMGELALVSSPMGVPSSQGSTAAITNVDRIWVPTSCTLLVPMGRGSKVVMVDVATGVAHPPGGEWHGHPISHDYTRVEVHTVKPDYMNWERDHETPEGLVRLGEVMK
jgi:hypothetical protein